jgi:serine/threonine-protein kinase
MKHLSSAPPPPSDFNKNVTPEMDRMVLRMIAKKPANRQKNLQEVMSEFRNVQPFKEDPEKLHAQKLAEAKANEGVQSLGKRLDSRSDHSRSEKAKVDPEFAKTLPVASPPPQPKVATPEPPKPAATKPPPAPAPKPAPPPMPMPMPPMMPGFAPQMPFGQMPMMPGQFAPMPGYPGMPPQMPGYGAGGPMPGMPPMQMPMQPAALMPQPGMPAMPGVAPQAPAVMSPPTPAPAIPAPPAAPAPARPATGSVVRPNQRPAPPPMAKDVENLPTMDELPDVM